MKYIISKTEEPINFNLTSSRSVVIDIIVPIQVTDEEYIVLESRLGSQIESVIVPGFSEEVLPAEAVVTPEVTPEVEVEVTPEVKEEIAPKVEEEEDLKEDEEE